MRKRFVRTALPGDTGSTYRVGDDVAFTVVARVDGDGILESHGAAVSYAAGHAVDHYRIERPLKAEDLEPGELFRDADGWLFQAGTAGDRPRPLQTAHGNPTTGAPVPLNPPIRRVTIVDQDVAA